MYPIIHTNNDHLSCISIWYNMIIYTCISIWFYARVRNQASNADKEGLDVVTWEMRSSRERKITKVRERDVGVEMCFSVSLCCMPLSIVCVWCWRVCFVPMQYLALALTTLYLPVTTDVIQVSLHTSIWYDVYILACLDLNPFHMMCFDCFFRHVCVVGS